LPLIKVRRFWIIEVIGREKKFRGEDSVSNENYVLHGWKKGQGVKK